MLDSLRKKTFLHEVPKFLVLFMVSLIPFILAVILTRDAAKEVVQLSDLSVADLKMGMRVEGDIDYNFGCYAEMGTSRNGIEQVTKLGYVIPMVDADTGDFYYMSMVVPAARSEVLDQMAENTYRGLVTEPAYHITAEVYKVSAGQQTDYYKSYFLDSGWTQEEFDSRVLMYNLDTLTGDSAEDRKTAVFMWIVTIILWSVLVVWMLKVYRGSHLKKLQSDIAGAGISLEQIENELGQAAYWMGKPDLYMGENLFFAFGSDCPRLFAAKNIVWIYLHQIIHRTNGIKTGTEYNVMVCTKDGEKHLLRLVQKTKADRAMELMTEAMPWIVSGYSIELDNIYQWDRDRFLKLKYFEVLGE